MAVTVTHLIGLLGKLPISNNVHTPHVRIDLPRKTVKDSHWSHGEQSNLFKRTTHYNDFLFRFQDTKLHFTSIIMDTSIMWMASALSIGFRCKEF